MLDISQVSFAKSNQHKPAGPKVRGINQPGKMPKAEKKRLKKLRKTKRHKRRIEELKALPYKDYLQSKHWKVLRNKKLRSTNFSCERCQKKAWQVHHKHYQTLGEEALSDLVSICGICHGMEHECLKQANSHLRAINGQSF